MEPREVVPSDWPPTLVALLRPTQDEVRAKSAGLLRPPRLPCRLADPVQRRDAVILPHWMVGALDPEDLRASPHAPQRWRSDSCTSECSSRAAARSTRRARRPCDALPRTDDPFAAQGADTFTAQRRAVGMLYQAGSDASGAGVRVRERLLAALPAVLRLGPVAADAVEHPHRRDHVPQSATSRRRPTQTNVVLTSPLTSDLDRA